MTSRMATIVSYWLDRSISVMSLFHFHQVWDYKFRLTRELFSTAKCCRGRNQIRAGRTLVNASRYVKAIRPNLEEFSEKYRPDFGPESDRYCEECP